MILVDSVGHMVSTQGPEELHEFAARLGLRHEWFQDNPVSPHYDLTTPRARERARDAGAKLMDSRLLVTWAWWSRFDRAKPIMTALAAWRLELANEAALQAQIAAALDAGGIPFEREAWLSPKDRIDFLAGPVGIEVKVKGGPTEIARQCARYCATGRISALVLATSRRIGLPLELEGVPCKELNLARSWL